MNPISEVISQSKRASNTSGAGTGDDKLTSAITNGINPNESESAGNESSETNGINKTVPKSENLSERNKITQDENNQRTTELQQEVIPKEENLEQNENNTSTERNISNEYNIAVDDEERQKNEGCCGCMVEVCYCITWYWRIVTDSVVSCFSSCGNSLRSLCHSRGTHNVADDDDGNYFYSDLNTLNTDIVENDDDGIIVVEEAPTVLTNNSSVPDGNDSSNCAVNEGFANRNVDGGGCDNHGADGVGDTSDAHCRDS